MLNNITNYTNLIDTRKVRTLLEATDLFTIGVRDSNFYGNYQPALITTTDLVSSIAGLLPAPITLTTVGSSGAATLIGSTLNIPNYAGGGSLPYWLEYNESDKTVWCNGNNNIVGNLSYGQQALAANTLGDSNTAIGIGALFKNTIGSSNTSIGYLSLQNNMSGQQNTAVGHASLNKNTIGLANTSIGWGASNSNLSGNFNTSLGNAALQLNTTGSNNVAIGNGALSNNTASNNTAIGNFALLSNTTGTFNTSLGYQSLRENITGAYNTAAGNAALGQSTTGGGNSAYGASALQGNVAGSNNTAVGTNSLYINSTSVLTFGAITPGSGYTDGVYTNITLNYVSGLNTFQYPVVNITVTGGIVTACTLVSGGLGYRDITTIFTSNLIGPGTGFQISPATLKSGTSNTAVGHSALFNNVSGTSNTAIGVSAFLQNTTGSNNIAIGNSAGAGNTTANNNTMIGVGTNSGNFNNSIILGFGAVANADNQFVVGSSSINAGTITSEINTSSNVWNVVINGVARKILLA